MQLKKGRWYGYKRINGKQRTFSLNAYEHETAKAQINLGKALETIERGELPNLQHKRFKKVAEGWLLNPVDPDGKNRGTDRYKRIVTKHLIPFFGDFVCREIKQADVFSYVAQRENPVLLRSGKEKPGASKSTLRKELGVLRWIVCSVNTTWTLPEVSFQNPGKTLSRIPTWAEFLQVSETIRRRAKCHSQPFEEIFWIIVFTGLDVSDVLHLTRESIQGEFLVGRRRKTRKEYKIPVVKQLRRIMDTLPVPLDPRKPFFHGYKAKAVSNAIRESFLKNGLSFHSKAIRHFFASTLHKGAELKGYGVSLELVQKAIGHSVGSKVTHTYLHAEERDLIGSASIFDSFPDIERDSG